MSNLRIFNNQMPTPVAVNFQTDGLHTVGLQTFETALAAFVVPGGLISTTVTFLGSFDGITYVPIKDVVANDGSNYTINLNAGEAGKYPVNQSIFIGMPWIQLEFGSAESLSHQIILIPWTTPGQK